MIGKKIDLKEYYWRRGMQTPEKKLNSCPTQKDHFNDNKTLSWNKKERENSLMNLNEEDWQKISKLILKL